MDVEAFQGAEVSAVVALKSVITHYKKMVVEQLPLLWQFVLWVAFKRVCMVRQVRLNQSMPVDVNKASIKGHSFSGQADDAFDCKLTAIIGDDHYVATLKSAIEYSGLDNVIGSERGIHAEALNDGKGSYAAAHEFRSYRQ